MEYTMTNADYIHKCLYWIE